MPFTGSGSGIQNADDVYFASVAQDNILRYNATTVKWNNIPAAGFVATATKGGQEALITNSAASGAVTINIAGGNVATMRLAGNVTFTFTGAVTGAACSFTLYLTQDGTGGRTVAWPASVKWSGGAPTLSTAANAVDCMVFESIDGGTTWYGSLVGTNFQ